ncbi:hypothetical protein I4U23_001324 [Adineta vaga]|nr:hypothetical protein I4U23_001324 [Adineta vaga]
MELGIYQDSIQLHSTYLNNTKMEFRSWASSKMHIYNSTLHNTHFEVNNGPITLSIYRSTFFNGSMKFYYNHNDIKIMDSMLAYVNIVVSGYYASSGRNYFALFRSTFLHGSLSIRDTSAYSIQSNIMLAGTPLLIGDNSRIQCTSITSLAGGSAVTAGIEATDVIIKNSSMYNFYTGIRVSKTSKISFSNIYDNHYNIENRGRNNIEANKSWWGTSNETEISEKIYDFYDDLNFGQVIFSNHFTSTIDLNSSQCSYTKSLTFYNSSIFPTTFTFVRDSPCFAVLFDDESMSNPENGFYSCGFKYSIASSSYNGIILSLSTYNKLLIFLYIFVPFIQLSIL